MVSRAVLDLAKGGALKCWTQDGEIRLPRILPRQDAARNLETQLPVPGISMS